MPKLRRIDQRSQRTGISVLVIDNLPLTQVSPGCFRQEVYEGRYGRPTGEQDFVSFVEEVYKPWALENKRSFKSNDKYRLPKLAAVNG